jgi:tRNA nucleotidyltransferase (CCA-adding enzyme)
MIPKRGMDMGKNHIPAGVSALCAALRGAGHEAYPVGGCVRDLLLGRAPEDWDVCTSALPEEVEALFEKTIPTGVVHGTVTVLLGREKIEVTTFRREGGYADARHPDAVHFDAGLTEDLSRRDFTVNAMALGPDGAVVDPFGGQADLKIGVIRCVGAADRRFAEDALRMLRAVRFSAQLGFAIEEKTASAIRANAYRAAALSGERVKAELEKILLSLQPQRVEVLAKAGVLNHLYSGWPAGADWDSLAAVPARRSERWRAFCALTGFPICALPVERSLRRAVEHPELELLAKLKISGGEICALGLRGPEVSAMQRRLAAHIQASPEDNIRETLLRLVERWSHERKNL